MLTLPEGIAQMDPDLDYIKYTGRYAPPVEVAFGGDADLLAQTTTGPSPPAWPTASSAGAPTTWSFPQTRQPLVPPAPR